MSVDYRYIFTAQLLDAFPGTVSDPRVARAHATDSITRAPRKSFARECDKRKVQSSREGGDQVHSDVLSMPRQQCIVTIFAAAVRCQEYAATSANRNISLSSLALTPPRNPSHGTQISSLIPPQPRPKTLVYC